MIRTQLSNFGTYLSQIGNKNVKSNAHFQTLIDTLTSRGETTHDLLTDIFKAYSECFDNNFINYVTYKHSKYKDGKDMTPNWLMKKSSNKYDILKTGGNWYALSAEEEELIALESWFSELKKRMADKKRSVNEDDNNQSSRKHNKGKNKKDNENPSWMFQ